VEEVPEELIGDGDHHGEVTQEETQEETQEGIEVAIIAEEELVVDLEEVTECIAVGTGGVFVALRQDVITVTAVIATGITTTEAVVIVTVRGIEVRETVTVMTVTVVIVTVVIVIEIVIEVIVTDLELMIAIMIVVQVMVVVTGVMDVVGREVVTTTVKIAPDLGHVIEEIAMIVDTVPGHVHHFGTGMIGTVTAEEVIMIDHDMIDDVMIPEKDGLEEIAVITAVVMAVGAG